MKKHLLTTTAAGGLVALMAAPAAAQDTEFGFDGFARAGMQYDDNSESFDIDTRFQLDASFKIVADAGLTFGGKTRMRVDTTDKTSGFSEPVIYMSTGEMKLSLGNISGVILNAPGLGFGTGLDGNGTSGVSVYFDGDQSVKNIEYGSDGVSAANGIQLDVSAAGFAMSAMSTEDSVGVSVGYSQDGMSFGAAYQQDDQTGSDDTLMVVGASYAVDALTVGASYAIADEASEAGDATKWSLNGSYAFNDATSVKAFAAVEDNTVNDGESYGLSVSRALGAGVTAVAGWEQDIKDDNYISAGVTMSF